jgi:hypothetical protein
MIIKFIVEIEVEDNLTKEECLSQAIRFDKITSDLADIVEAAGFEPSDREWVSITN